MDECTNKKVFKPWPLGWKAKIGLLVPSQEDGYVTYEFRKLCPDGVVTLSTRVMGGNLTMEMLNRMRQDALYAAELIAVAAPDVITYEPTAASFVLGVDGDKALIKEIQEKVGIPATTGASAVAESLRFLGVKKMILYSPNYEEITMKSVNYFGDLGFEVSDHESLGEEIGANIHRVTPWELYSKVMNIYKRCPNVDGIFISGACFRTLEMIDTLEKDSGLPVVTTIVGNMFRCLQLAGVSDPVYGFGQLLEKAR
ncbi:hypothetical protein ACFLYF_06210 [Chloroflexota bacterium]